MTDIFIFLEKYNIDLYEIKKCVGFSISLYSLYLYLLFIVNDLLFVNNDKEIIFYHYLNNIIGVKSTIELFFKDSMIHKIRNEFIVAIIIYDKYYGITSDDGVILSAPLIHTEIPYIFYCLMEMNDTYKDLWYSFYYLAFFKFGIYNFYYEIIYNHYSFDYLFKLYPPTENYISNIGFLSYYGLFIFNLYWFITMNKELYNKLAIKIDTYQLSHFICSGLQYISPPLFISMYSFHVDRLYTFDIIAISMLCNSSYNYHHFIYTENKNIDHSVPTEDTIDLFLKNILNVHIKSFLSILTNYYHHKRIKYVFSFLGILHGLSIFMNYSNTIQLFFDHKNKNTFLINHDIINGIPLLIDVLFFSINSKKEIRIPYLLVNTILLLVYVIKPFNKLNHVAINLILMIQTYYTCLSNINNICRL